MTVNTTAAGVTHLAELDATWPPPVTVTNAFDCLELGKGNTAIAALVTRDIALSKLSPPGLVQLLAGYPVLGDTDPANPGAAADYYTWAYRINGAQNGPLVASTGWITNYAGGAPLNNEPVGWGWDDILQLRTDQVVTVYFNAKTGAAPNVHFVFEEITTETALAATYTQRATHVASFPQARRVGPNEHHAEVVEGTPLFIMARMLGEMAQPLVRQQVDLVRVNLYREDQRTGRFALAGVGSPYAVDETVALSPVVTDPRWPHLKGFNVALWLDVGQVAPGKRVLAELEVHTALGPVEPVLFFLTVLPRAGRYGGV